ncbi:MAG: serine--tRNA ligase [bacterium]|nr:serine--tRNA ligase [bacterium]
MLDLKLIQENPQALSELLKKRRSKGVDTNALTKLLEDRRALLTKTDDLRNERNVASKEIGALIGKGEKDAAEKRKAEVKGLGDDIAKLEGELSELEDQLQEIVQGLPNWLDESVPEGEDESANVELRVIGEKPTFDFTPQPHYEIGEKLGILDFERGVKLAGSRYYAYRGLAARLERALISFMLDTHTNDHGYTEMYVPALINDDGMYTTGQFPKFRGEYYSLDRDGLSLIPTSEVPLVNLHRDEILAEDELPLALTAATSCFRREAGAAGKDTRGLIRVHQFQKVELVQFVQPDESERLHEAMLGHAETILQKLGLTYRVLLLCSGDIGATAVKTYDLEVWMPGLDRWLEISSVSNCRDYQARRGMIRFKGTGGTGGDKKNKKAKTAYVHTLNGSGVAAGRCMAAIMENYQKADGTFDIPDALQKYF